MNQYGNTNLPALEFFRYDQPCSNGTLLPQEEEQQQQLSSFIELAKKICEFKNQAYNQRIKRIQIELKLMQCYFFIFEIDKTYLHILTLHDYFGSTQLF